VKALQLNDAERQGFEDLRWGLRAAEVRQHAGKLVAVHNQRVVAVGMDRKALIAEAAEKAQCPKEDVTVIVVPAPDLTELPR
jgi:hypothetical protein